MPRHRVGSIKDNGNGSFRVRVQRGSTTRTETVYGSRQDAEIRAAQIASEMGRSKAWDRSVTLRDYYQNVFRSSNSNRGRPRGKATLIQYDHVMSFFLPYIGDEPINSLTHEQIASLIKAAPSPNNAKKIIRAVLRAAYDEGLIDYRPLDRRVHTPVEKRPKVQPWSFSEASRALDLIPEIDEVVGRYLILGLSGLRKEEALGIRFEDIDRDMAHVKWVYTDATGHIPIPKNDSSERYVPLLMELGIGEGRCVPLTEDQLRKRWANALKLCNVRYIPPKMLRHSSDTLMLSLGVSPDLNAKMHGRTDPSTTYRHYYRPSERDMKEAMRTLRAAVEPTSSDSET